MDRFARLGRRSLGLLVLTCLAVAMAATPAGGRLDVAASDYYGAISLDGTPTSVTIAAANDNAVLSFDGTANQRVFFRFSPVGVGSSSCCSVRVAIRSASGSVLAGTEKYIGTSGGFIDTTMLSAAGAYELFVDPQGTATGSLTVAAFDVPADLAPALQPSQAGTAETLTIAVPGQNGLPTFSGSDGQRVFVNFTAVSVGTSSCCGLRVSIRKPDGTTLGTEKYIGTSGGFIDTAALPVTGVYRVVVDPDGSAIGNVTVTTYDVPDDVEPALQPSATGATETVSIATPGQNAMPTLPGFAGQRIFVNLTGISIGTSSCCGLRVSIRKPDGTALGTEKYIGTSGGFIDTATLPVEGTYRVKVDPDGAAVGSITLTVYDVPPDSAIDLDPSEDAAWHEVEQLVPGQNVRPTFAGTAGQKVFVNLTDFAVGSSSCCSAVVALRKPDGTTVTGTERYIGTSGGFIDVVTLPTNGTYTVSVDPAGAAAGALATAVNEVPADVTADLVVGGVPTTLSTVVPGQSLAPRFDGVAGQDVSILLSNVGVGTSSCCGTLVTIKKPDGTNLVSQQYVGTSGASIAATLPVTGTYTVFANPDGAAVGAITFAVGLPAAPTNTLAPTITGDAVVGSTLTASSGSWTGSPTSLEYSWQRCDASACGDVFDGDGETYVVGEDDASASLRVVVAAANAGGSATKASAQTAPVATARPAPKWTRSYYVGTTTYGTWYDLGCALGNSVQSGSRPRDASVFLTMGKPSYSSTERRYGTVIYTVPGFRSTRTLRTQVVQPFGLGYYVCAGTNSKLLLIAGTTNLGSRTTRAHGFAWGNMVDATNAYFRNECCIANQVRAIGGNDIELAWNTPAATRAWSLGYASATRYPYYANGEASGCPPAGVCNPPWTNEDVYYVNWRNPRANPFPQIYREDGLQASQWQQLSAYGASTHGKRMVFGGAMTQYQACFDTNNACGHDTSGTGDDLRNHPNEGWQQLYNAINASTSTRGPVRYSSDIRWDPEG